MATSQLNLDKQTWPPHSLNAGRHSIIHGVYYLNEKCYKPLEGNVYENEEMIIVVNAIYGIA